MKNAIFKSFTLMLILISVVFFDYIESLFISLSDIMYDVFGLKFDLVCVILVVLFVALFVWFLIYLFIHREKDDLVEVVEFDCPNDMTPVELGFFVDGVVDSEDISSLIVYWASKKYVEISGEGKNQKVKKLVDKLPEGCKKYEIELFNTIFKTSEVSVEVLGQRTSGSEAVTNLVKTVENDVGKKYFQKSTIRARQLFLCGFAFLLWFAMFYFRLEYFFSSLIDATTLIVEVVCIAMVCLLVLATDWHLKYYDYRHKNNAKKGRVFSLVVLILLFLAEAAVSGFFFWDNIYQAIFVWAALAIMFAAIMLSKKMQIYTAAGWEKLGKVMGFKQFLEVAEKDRIKMLVEENPNVFYDVLPYAFVLGVSDKWIKDMNVISTENPSDKQLTKSVATVVALQMLFSLSPRITIYRGVTQALKKSGISFGGGRGGGSRGGGIGGIRRR